MTADLVIVGAGPAGAAAALGALRSDPDLDVVLVDRSDFPRDKACGDGVAPHVLDLLEAAGVHGLLDDRVPAPRLRLRKGDVVVERATARPAYVVPRTVLDARLVEAAQAAGARLLRHRVRSVEDLSGELNVDGVGRTRVVVGADGARSQVARSLGVSDGPLALALRGYAPTPGDRAGVQSIVFGTRRQPSYAWAFDRGDGLSNVGYGELLTRRRPGPTRRDLLLRLEELIPGAAAGGTSWTGHHLPLSTARPLRVGHGRVLLVGDAAGLVNPLTGEGIYYAVATGLQAGRTAAEALRGRVDEVGVRYQRRVRRMLGRHLRHTAAAARLSLHERVLDAGLRASARDQRVFDDLVDLGLAQGTLTPRLARGLLRSLPHRPPSVPSPPAPQESTR